MAVKAATEFYKFVNRFARKLAAKPSAEGIMTIPNQETVRDLSNEILTKFMKYNVPKEAIKSENDVKVIYNQIIGMENQTFTKNLKTALTPKKSGDVIKVDFDPTGKKIRKKITEDKLLDFNVPFRNKESIKTIEQFKKNTSPQQWKKIIENLESIKIPKEPFQGFKPKIVPETEAQIKTKLEGMNKKTVDRIRRRRFEAAQKAEREKMAKDPEYIPEILDPDDFAGGGLAPMLGEPTYADGGRTGFKKGTKFDPKRRGFLKLAAGLASIPIIGKYFKWAKPLAKASKTLTSVPIKNIKGMPPWFKLAVNRAIKQGEEISSHGDRIITHVDTLPNSKTKIYVEQDLNTGNVVMDIGEGKHGWNQGHLGQPVRLEYKASEVIEPTINKQGKVTNKGTKTKEEFNVEEAEFTGGHPENVKFEESTLQKYGEHGSDFSEVEKYARGKNTVIVKGKETTHHPKTKKAERTEYESGKAEADAEAYWDEHGDFASGGRVPFFLGGRYPEGAALLRNMIRYFAKESKHGKKPSEYLKISNPKQYQKLLNDLSMYKKYSPGEGIMAPQMIKDMIKKTGVERAGVIEHIIGAARNIKKADDSTAAYTKTVVDDLVKKGADKKTAEMFAEGMSKAVTKGIGPKGTPKITDQGLLELETIYKNMLMKEGRKLNATGGRVSLSAGGLAGMLGE